ncbi:MFS transporter [Cypionkella sp.]|uniref:MFS transporter n=1 Tax=Cypionkella sp. TaxID=2811411 RepID=UPI002718AD55|nr:MFS transporter [Cypionkella sp.]MDO8985311.1 MFS transporter [Cypionkella sp.]MDP2051797.1 MFS transporter [Cypionkella sp.]
MALRYQSLELKHSSSPKLQHFALLAGLEAAVRGMLISTIPIAVYDAFGSAQNLSTVYLTAGIITLFWGLMVPRLTQIWPRRWVYSAGCVFYLVSMVLFVLGTQWSVQLGILIMSMATVTCFVCFNAYVLDYVPRADLGRTQSLQMVYAAAPWAIGPMSGVYMRALWAPLPFIVAAVFAVILFGVFWYLRLGSGKQIARAKGPAVNPLAYLGRFFRQPRLIAGWLFAVIRSCGWWVYVVYVPVYCIESGLGDKLGGFMLSVSNATLLLSPFMAAWVRRRSVRVALRRTLAYCAILFCAATILAFAPTLTIACLFLGSFGLVMLDVVGGLPFMMSVKPSERAEMAAVYSSFRDVSGIATPAMAWLVLWVAPLNFIFAASGLAFGAAYVIAGKLHPRLGNLRPSRGRL